MNTTNNHTSPTILDKTMNKAVVQLVFTLLVFLVFVYAAYEAQNFKRLARYFPYYVSIISAGLIFIELIRQIIFFKKEYNKGELLHEDMRGVFKYTFLLTLYILLAYIIGIIPASFVYVTLFLILIAKMKPWKALLLVIILLTLLIIFARVMVLYWPKSLITIPFIDSFL